MRVYHFLSAKYALDDLRQGRLKVAEFADLNDPFELLSVELGSRVTRRRFAGWRRNAVAAYGVLCFSKSWKSPVLWSHYADKHRGICLGFQVPDTLLQNVAYLKRRALVGSLLAADKSSGQPGPLFHTKFEHWRYENEVRRIVRLETAIKQDGHHFWPFGKNLELMEVVVGCRCSVEKSELEHSLGDRARGVTLTKARLAFTKFEVVTQQRGFRTSRPRRTLQSSGSGGSRCSPATADRRRSAQALIVPQLDGRQGSGGLA